MGWIRSVVGLVVGPVRRDLEADPWLAYLLVAATALCGFGFWFRVPNFAVADEYSRLIDPMTAAGTFISDPSFESLQRGVLDGRALGATFYLYALVLAPVFLVIVLTGQLGEFATLGTLESRWELWHAAPDWFWTSTILLGRLLSVAFGIGCVYLTYRLGTELHDRFAGRVAALALALSVGFFSQTHLVGEDAPMLFFLLATLVLAERYARSGSRTTFLAGCVTGGLAIAFKLSGGVAAIALGVAHVERARRSDDVISELLRPSVVLGGVAVGLVTVALGIPSVLVGGPGELLTRATGSVASKTGKSGGLDAPIWYWFTMQYLRGFGTPLFLAIVGGIGATLWDLGRSNSRVHPLYVLSGVVLGTYLLVYGRWQFVRLRHLVPTMPILTLLLGAAISRRRTDGGLGRYLRVALAVVLVTTALFAGGAQYQYVTEPRDDATAWLVSNTDSDASVEVYENSIADVAVPHGRETVHYDFVTTNVSSTRNETSYTRWLYELPERNSSYVQVTGSALAYLDPANPESDRFPDRGSYFRRLLNEEFNYTVVARFGTRPTYPSLGDRLLLAGTVPDCHGCAEYVVILERESPGTEGR